MAKGKKEWWVIWVREYTEVLHTEASGQGSRLVRELELTDSNRCNCIFCVHRTRHRDAQGRHSAIVCWKNGSCCFCCQALTRFYSVVEL